MKIGLFGGTFDPIHYAHVQLAQVFLEQMHLDEVWFLVTPQNPWKQGVNLAPDQQRLEMTRLALADHPQLIASDYEFHLKRPSYSYETLQHLRQDYPDNEFTLIIGADNWMAFDKWANYEEILEHHPIAVYPRWGDKLLNITWHVPGYARVTILDAPMMHVSSTVVRTKIKTGNSIEGLVNPRVEQYISKHGLYR